MSRRTLRQAVLFLLVGGTSAAIDAGGFWLLTRLGIAPPWASAMSFCAAFAVNYAGNRDVVFRGGRSAGSLRRYVILVCVNLVLSTGIVALLTAIGAAPLLAKAISMAVIAAGNFLALRWWVFPAGAPDPAPGPAPADQDEPPVGSPA